MKTSSRGFSAFVVACWLGAWSHAAELPQELPLWDAPPTELSAEAQERVRAPEPAPGSPSGSNRVFSFVSSPTYSIHRPEQPNGVGLVICPGGGYRDVWLDREGHDLAIWLKDRHVTSLVLKYRTNTGDGVEHAYSWEDYLPAVKADARQAIRILRKSASDLGLQPHKIGICGFSAGGNLALITMLDAEADELTDESTDAVSGTPDFTGLFYPWFRDDYTEIVNRRMAPGSAAAPIGPVFMMNAIDDPLTPVDTCVDFYAMLLKAGVPAELHAFSKGSHGFDLGAGRGASAAIWPTSFVAWLRDANIIEQ